MNELEDPDVQHREILAYAQELGISRVLTVGEKIGKIAPEDYHFNEKSALEKELKKMDFSHATVLLKASRSIKLETTLNSIG